MKNCQNLLTDQLRCLPKEAPIDRCARRLILSFHEIPQTAPRPCRCRLLLRLRDGAKIELLLRGQKGSLLPDGEKNGHGLLRSRRESLPASLHRGLQEKLMPVRPLGQVTFRV